MKQLRLTKFMLLGLRGALSDVLEPRNCHANNCAREITGTGAHITPDLTSRLADCSSYMASTVSVGSIETASKKRTVPVYATPFCSDAAENSSVCSCAGTTQMIVTGDGVNTAQTSSSISTTISTTISTSVSTSSTSSSSSQRRTEASTSPTSSPESSTSPTSSSSSPPLPSTSPSTSSSTSSSSPTPSPSTSSFTCNPPLQQCTAGSCSNLQTDNSNCGACGAVCPAQSICQSGACTTTLDLATRCTPSAMCDPDLAFSCQTGCGGDRGYCQPDVSGQGRCRAPPINPNCDLLLVCASNADCVGGYCIQSCCPQPTCYYFGDQAFCVNGSSVKRLFVKRGVMGEKGGLPRN
ncbi:hypothetical protein BJ875DRAFT_540005 [Amylocarpus encephaloides]|uniref:Uncharacterized protein n=1 Tax=Amylocarpus encephaloides TaxID=45428 RepID=A0A9P7YRR1_9HELO|nr:hypothetical protein BJ875DRAFT_540005 [Amylocarpus encephaloides]